MSLMEYYESEGKRIRVDIDTWDEFKTFIMKTDNISEEELNKLNLSEEEWNDWRDTFLH